MPKPKIKPKRTATRAPLPWLNLFIGDTHVLSDTGLVIDQYPLGSKEKRPYPASSSQLWLYKSFQDLLQQTKQRALDHRLAVHFGGDMCDGVQHHGSTQTTGTPEDQIDMTVKLLKPFVDISDYACGVTGTEAHVQQQGSSDATIYRELGISAIGAHLETIFDGRLLWQRHHGISAGSREWTKDNALFLMAKDLHFYCTERAIRPPDCVIGHDRHKSPHPIAAYGISVAVCGCWQLPTYFGDRWLKSTDIGALFWTPKSNHIERLMYVQPQTHQIIK